MKFVHFTMQWRIQWAQYDSIQGEPLWKAFSTPYSNIPVQWYAAIQSEEEDRKSFFIYYNGGPLETIAGVEFESGIVKRDGTMHAHQAMIKFPVERGQAAAGCWVSDDNSKALRARYGLTETDRLVLQLTVKIPVGVFSYTIPIPPLKSSASCLIELFNTIEVPNNSSFPDAKLISRDNVVFYCHKNVIAVQSEPLATMLRDPLAGLTEGDDQQHPPPATNTSESASSSVEKQSKKKKKKGEYDFPKMAGASLKAMVEYLYTGQATMVNLSTCEVIEVADAAEQYALKSLKEACGVELWKRVVDDPQSAFQIARFADLHDDMEWLKYRAFDVIVESFDDSTFVQFGGTRPEELHDEFTKYAAYRLRPFVKP